MKKTEKRARGDRGENAAVRFLRFRFYRILDRNFRAGGAEIDIVAKKGKTLVFVEVKTRRVEPDEADRLTRPAAAVTREKQEHIVRAAKIRLAARPMPDCSVRFDVIEVYLDPRKDRDRVIRIEHVKAAFTA